MAWVAGAAVLFSSCGTGGESGAPTEPAPTSESSASEVVAAPEAATTPSGEDIVDDPDAELIDLATSPTDPDVRVGVWRTCLDPTCGSITVAMALTTDGFDTRAVPDRVWRTTPTVEVDPSGAVLVVSWRTGLSLEVVRPDGTVLEVRRTDVPSKVMRGDLVGGVSYGRRTTYYATDVETAVAHPVAVPEQTNQLEQLPSGQLRATTLDRMYAWSDDGGASWQRVAGGTDGTKLQLMADSAPDVHVLIGGSDGATLFPFDEVRRLEDLDSWSVARQPGAERAYLGNAAVLSDGRLLLDVEDWSDRRPGGLFVSQGRDWVSFERVASGAPFDGRPADVRVLDMRVDQDASTIVAVGPEGRDAWFSDDLGTTWVELPAR